MTSTGPFITVLLLAFAAAGCVGGDAPIPSGQAALYDYRLKNPVRVEPRMAVLELVAQRDGPIGEERARLRAFVGEYLRRGSGAMELSVGAVSADDLAARGFAQAVAGRLLEEGLKRSELGLQLIIDAPGLPPGKAMLSFSSAAAQLPDCQDWSPSVGNAPLPNYGCSIQRNVGAMLADPRDLERARPFDPSAGARTSDAIDKVMQGAAPWSVALPWGTSSVSGSGSGGK